MFCSFILLTCKKTKKKSNLKSARTQEEEEKMKSFLFADPYASNEKERERANELKRVTLPFGKSKGGSKRH
jgi:hypothetical protein